MLRVVDEQHHPDEEEQHELRKDDHAAPEQCLAGLPRILRAEVALHHQLVGAVGRRGEEGSPDEARPECITAGEGWREVEQLKAACRAGHLPNLAPAPRDLPEQHDSGDHGPGRVDDQLRDVGPDNGCHAAEVRVRHRCQADHQH